jgi:phosphoadenosine phosphosulfate reductase
MLIQSPRHTPRDLELWGEYEGADLIHYTQGRVADKAAAAVDVIRRFALDGPCYAAVSWGKDSTVLSHLAVACGVRLGWARWPGVDNPDSERVRDVSGWPVVEAWGAADDREDGRGGFAALAAVCGTDRVITGLRADESTSRRLSAWVHGHVTAQTCRPLLFWSTADVFAYLASHRLPVHPAYAMLGDGRWDRARLRVDVLGDSRGTGGGRNEWEAEYYGDVLRRIQANR